MASMAAPEYFGPRSESWFERRVKMIAEMKSGHSLITYFPRRRRIPFVSLGFLFSVNKSTSHLRIADFLIFRAGFKKFLVGSSADDFSVIKNKNFSAVLNGTYPLGNGDNGGTGKLGIKSFSKRRVGFVVKGGGRIVKDYDIRFCGNGPCDKKALALSAGKICSFRSDNVFIFFRKSFDEIFRLGDFRGSSDFIFGKVSSERNVFADSVRIKKIA